MVRSAVCCKNNLFQRKTAGFSVPEQLHKLSESAISGTDTGCENFIITDP